MIFLKQTEGQRVNVEPANITVSVLATVVANNYSIAILGAGPASSHSVSVLVQVTDINIVANPSLVLLPRGSYNSSTIMISGINGFSGTATLSAIIAPVVPKSPTTSLDVSGVVLSSGSSAKAILIISASHRDTPGIYAITITVTSGVLSVSKVITINVIRAGLADFGVRGDYA